MDFEIGDLEYRKESELFKLYNRLEQSMLFKSPLHLFTPEKKTPEEIREEARLKRELKKFLAKAQKEQEMFKYLTYQAEYKYNTIIGKPKSLYDFSDEDLLTEMRDRMNRGEDY